MDCYACKKPIPMRVYPGDHEEIDNALIICIVGGYGMFTDHAPWLPKYGNYDTEHVDMDGMTICHECAHELCTKVPMFNELIKPFNSHSHTSEYHDQHPDHEGWDYEHEDEA